MFRRLKLLKKMEKSSAMREAKTIDYADDGRAQILVGISDGDAMFSPYSYWSYELLDPSVVDYINMCEASIPLNDEISLEIHTEEPTTNIEKKRIRKAVKRHNAEQLVIINKKLKRNLFIGLSFCLLGLLIMFLTAFFYVELNKFFIQEILAIIGWLFLWDGLEYVLEDRSELKRKKLRYLRLMNAKVHVRKYARNIRKAYGLGEFEEDDDDE